MRDFWEKEAVRHQRFHKENPGLRDSMSLECLVGWLNEGSSSCPACERSQCWQQIVAVRGAGLRYRCKCGASW